jgi:hypothetical protein
VRSFALIVQDKVHQGCTGIIPRLEIKLSLPIVVDISPEADSDVSSLELLRCPLLELVKVSLGQHSLSVAVYQPDHVFDGNDLSLSALEHEVCVVSDALYDFLVRVVMIDDAKGTDSDEVEVSEGSRQLSIKAMFLELSFHIAYVLFSDQNQRRVHIGRLIVPDRNANTGL